MRSASSSPTASSDSQPIIHLLQWVRRPLLRLHRQPLKHRPLRPSPQLFFRCLKEFLLRCLLLGVQDRSTGAVRILSGIMNRNVGSSVSSSASPKTPRSTTLDLPFLRPVRTRNLCCRVLVQSICGIFIHIFGRHASLCIGHRFRIPLPRRPTR